MKRRRLAALAGALVRLADRQSHALLVAGAILNGARPGDLPVQQPSLFELTNQPPDGKDTWPDGAADAPHPRRGGIE